MKVCVRKPPSFKVLKTNPIDESDTYISKQDGKTNKIAHRRSFIIKDITIKKSLDKSEMDEKITPVMVFIRKMIADDSLMPFAYSNSSTLSELMTDSDEDILKKIESHYGITLDKESLRLNIADLYERILSLSCVTSK